MTFGGGWKTANFAICANWKDITANKSPFCSCYDAAYCEFTRARAPANTSVEVRLWMLLKPVRKDRWFFHLDNNICSNEGEHSLLVIFFVVWHYIHLIFVVLCMWSCLLTYAVVSFCSRRISFNSENITQPQKKKEKKKKNLAKSACHGDKRGTKTVDFTCKWTNKQKKKRENATHVTSTFDNVSNIYKHGLVTFVAFLMLQQSYHIITLRLVPHIYLQAKMLHTYSVFFFSFLRRTRTPHSAHIKFSNKFLPPKHV